MSSNPKFPGPNINRLIENDPQIIKVPMASTDWGGSKRSQPANVKNNMTIKHVGDKKGK